MKMTKCTFIARLSDIDLTWLLNQHLYTADLLEHAAFCNNCGPRISMLLKREADEEYEKLSPEERRELDAGVAKSIERFRWEEKAIKELERLWNLPDAGPTKPAK